MVLYMVYTGKVTDGSSVCSIIYTVYTLFDVVIYTVVEVYPPPPECRDVVFRFARSPPDSDLVFSDGPFTFFSPGRWEKGPALG